MPSCLVELTSLIRLALSNNELLYLPDAIGQLKNLTWLDATSNKLVALPESICQLSELTGLGASDCRISELPLNIGKLGKLHKLGLFGNRLTYLPSSICDLSALTKLDLSHNSLKELPEDFGSLQSLAWINLTGNQLKRLPESVSKLVNLKEVGLSENLFEEVPMLKNSQDLAVLPLYRNSIKVIPRWFLNLKKLEKIDMSYNQVEILPHFLFTHPTLTCINVSGNLLKRVGQVAPRLMNTSKIQKLNISNNPDLSFVSDAFLQLPHLKEFIADGPDMMNQQIFNKPLLEEYRDPRCLTLKEIAVQKILLLEKNQNPIKDQTEIREVTENTEGISSPDIGDTETNTDPDYEMTVNNLRPWSSMFPTCQPAVCVFEVRACKGKIPFLAADSLTLCQKAHYKCFSCDSLFEKEPFAAIRLLPCGIRKYLPVQVSFCGLSCASRTALLKPIA